MSSTSLRCRVCATDSEPIAVASCPSCGGQLHPVYDWERIRDEVDRDALAARRSNIWRYTELLPIDSTPDFGYYTGGTPLLEAPGLASLLNVGRVWLKCDGQCFPSLSFKDRVVSVAVTKALELGITTVGCPSTGNLANSVAAIAAAAGLDAWIFVPDSVEPAKVIGTAVYSPNLVRVQGTYDDANALARKAAESYGWGIVNVNLRASYGEGSRTVAFEIAEQLGWRAPTAVICPMGGGSLISRMRVGFSELRQLGWIESDVPRMLGAQAAGCSPIVDAFVSHSDIVPVDPDTISRSIAIGDPVDGDVALGAIRETGGAAVAVTDSEMTEGIRLLAAGAGVFTETAGGVAVSAARKFAARGVMGADDELVICLTGNGMKTIDAMEDSLLLPNPIEPEIEHLEKLL